MHLTLELTPDDACRLTAIADREKRPVADIARDALQQFLDDDADGHEWLAGILAAWETGNRTSPRHEARAEISA